MMRIWTIAIAILIGAGCTNVIPTEMESKIKAQQKKEVDYKRSVRELWVLETTQGNIMFRLFPDMAPEMVKQVRAWTEANVYDGTWFHRVVNKPRPFIVQGGDPDSKYLKPATTTTEKELQLEQLGFGTADPALPFKTTKRLHKKGALALAVATDHSRVGPQFVIALTDLPHLDDKEPVIGQLVGGWSVLLKLRPGDKIIKAKLLPPEEIPGNWLSDLPVEIKAP